MAELSNFVKIFLARKERERAEAREDAQRKEDYAFRQQGVDLQQQSLEEQRRAAQATEVFRGRTLDLQQQTADRTQNWNIFNAEAQGLSKPATAKTPGAFDLGGGHYRLPTSPADRATTQREIEIQNRRALQKETDRRIDEFLTTHGSDLDDDDINALRMAASLGYQMPQATRDAMIEKATRNQMSGSPRKKAMGNAMIANIIRVNAAGSYNNPNTMFQLQAEQDASEAVAKAMLETKGDVNKAYDVAYRNLLASGKRTAAQSVFNLKQTRSGSGELSMQERLNRVTLGPIVEAMERQQREQAASGAAEAVPTPIADPLASPPSIENPLSLVPEDFAAPPSAGDLPKPKYDENLLPAIFPPSVLKALQNIIWPSKTR